MSKRDHMQTLQGILQGRGLNIPDGSVYAGPLHEGQPDACITMVPTGGPTPDDQFGGTKSIQYPTLQIRIRHGDHATGKADADEVWRIAHDVVPTDYSPTRMLQSGPLYLGQDGAGRHEWAVNVELFIYE